MTQLREAYGFTSLLMPDVRQAMWTRLRSLPLKKREGLAARVFVASWIWLMLLMGIGVIRSIHAPIRPEGGRFLDKMSREFSEAAFHQFKIWETTLWLSFLSFAVIYLLSHWILGIPLRWQPQRPKKLRE